MAGLDLVQGDLEHQIGPMGLGAHAEIGGEQESQIELIDRLVDGAGARWSAGRESSIASHSGDRGFQGGTAKRSSRDGSGVEAGRRGPGGRACGATGRAGDGSEVEVGVSSFQGLLSNVQDIRLQS